MKFLKHILLEGKMGFQDDLLTEIINCIFVLTGQIGMQMKTFEVRTRIGESLHSRIR
jgi:hypothetical protein